MNHPRSEPFRYLSDTQHGAPIIIEFDNIPMPNPSNLGILRVDSHRLPFITVFFHSMTWDISQPRYFVVMMGVKREPGMGCKQLEWIFFSQLGGVSFPARDIPWHGRSFIIIREMGFQTLRDKLYLTAIGSQFMSLCRAPLGIKKIRGIASPPLIEPSQCRRGFVVFRQRDLESTPFS